MQTTGATDEKTRAGRKQTPLAHRHPAFASETPPATNKPSGNHHKRSQCVPGEHRPARRRERERAASASFSAIKIPTRPTPLCSITCVQQQHPISSNSGTTRITPASHRARRAVAVGRKTKILHCPARGVKYSYIYMKAETHQAADRAPRRLPRLPRGQRRRGGGSPRSAIGERARAPCFP